MLRENQNQKFVESSFVASAVGFKFALSDLLSGSTSTPLHFVCKHNAGEVSIIKVGIRISGCSVCMDGRK